MNSFYGPDCIKFLTYTCRNCIKVSIDDYSFMYTASQQSELLSTRGTHWRAEPFPADIHWHSKMAKPYPWEHDHHRDIIVSFIGTNISYHRGTAKVRNSLIRQCLQHRQDCVWHAYGSAGSLEHRDFSSINVINGSSIHSIVNRSVFCLTPPGDLPTRKGLFDSLLLGCIPVTMHPLTASAMYTWHWNESLWKSVLVELPNRQAVRDRRFDAIKFLVDLYTHNRSIVYEKQKLIRENAFNLQYSYVEDGAVTPPGKDAYDTTIDSILDKIRGVTSGIRPGSIPSCGWSC